MSTELMDMSESKDMIYILAGGNFFWFMLWLASEVLGSSNCEYNGVIHLLFNGCSCLGGNGLRVDITVGENERLINNAL